MKKEYKIKGYMTFRDNKPLKVSDVSLHSYDFYLDEARVWQDGDKSVPVILTYKI